MSIHPAAAVLNTIQGPLATGRSHDRASTSPTSAQPTAEPDPKRETASSTSNRSLSELPRDEVQLQRDTQTCGEIVVRYMDASGNLVLQVPSQQILAMERDFRQAQEHEQTGRSLSPGGHIDPMKESGNGH